MTIKQSYLSILLLVMSFSCRHESGRAIEKRLTGLNGPCIYYYDDSDNLMNVQKEEYYTESNHNIMINKDTIRMGEEFVGLLFVQPNYKVTVTEPERTILENDSTHYLRDFRYKPQALGLYNFKGQIEYDSTVVTFEYKFIVLPEK